MEKLERAKQILKEKNASLVIIDDEVEVYNDIGVKRLLILLSENRKLKDSAVADNVIGKAAAFLYIKLDAKNIFAKIISEDALLMLKQKDIFIEYEIIVKNILNRNRDDICPIEKSVMNERDVDSAIIKIKNTIKEIMKK